MLNTDICQRFTSVPKRKFVHGKSDVILIILAKGVHTEHVTSRQSTNVNLTFVRNILFPVCRCGNMHFYGLFSPTSVISAVHDFVPVPTVIV